MQQYLQNWKGLAHKKIGLHAFHINLYLHEFFELILFFDPHRLQSMVQKGNLAIFLRPAKGEKSLKLERSHPPKLFCIYFTSTSMCIIFLSRNLALLEANGMGEKISSRRGHAHKNFVCMYFTSTPTCINFLNHFYF